MMANVEAALAKFKTSIIDILKQTKEVLQTAEFQSDPSKERELYSMLTNNVLVSAKSLTKYAEKLPRIELEIKQEGINPQLISNDFQLIPSKLKLIQL